MAEYDRRPNKFLLRGVNITLPPDLIGKEYAEILKNVRIYRGGEVRQRPGLSLLGDLDGGSTAAVLWAMRTSDPLTLPAFRRLFGTQDGSLYIDDGTHAAFSSIDTGYDGLGYSSIVARPDRSPSPFYFVANGSRQSKFTALGVRSNWGLSAPLVPPTVELTRPAYRLINDCNNAADFTGAGSGIGALTDPTRINAITMTHILYDTGTTGWASVSPASMDENWQEGIFITTSAFSETVLIESIYSAIASTTIGAIVYDNTGLNTGLCTIQLAVPTEGLQRNSMLRLNSAENVRVLSVTIGLDGIPSFRCSTVGTFSAGQSVDGLRSFRAYFDNNHTTAETVSTDYVNIPITGATFVTVTRTVGLDLSSSNVGANRPIQADDWVHISFLVSDFSAISEIQLQFDFDNATNTFAQNYFFTSIRQPDLTNVISQAVVALTGQQQELQRQELDRYRQDQIATLQNQRSQQVNALLGEKNELYVEFFTRASDARRAQILRRFNEIDALIGGQPFVIDQGLGPVSSVGASGAQQWSEIKVPISKFQRVGSDTTRGWKDIAAFRITITTTATVTIGMDAIWIGGTYGPDSSGASRGYNYVYVARNTGTGSMSNPSPPTRSPILAEREGITATIPAGYSDAQADVFDIYRIGGTLGTYQYVGTVPSSAPTFVDTLPDDTVLQQRITEFDRFQPWPRPDRPKSGTGTLVGTRFTRTSGDTFNTSWARGTQIIINNQTATFYSQPESTNTVQLNESLGSGVGVSWEIPEPLLVGQPLPAIFGPYKGGSGEYHFAVGDPINPGYLYFTNGNDPESASDANILELCSPEEKLMNGGILDGIVYVYSDRRSWRILPSFNGGATGSGSLFYDQETAMGKGLAAKWALCFGDRIYWVSYDGVYASRGDAIESLTDDSIAPLFRRDGSGYNQTLGGLVPISFAEADEKYHHLTYSRDGLYHDYRGTDGGFYTNFYSFLTQGWTTDIYTNPVTFTLREEDPYTDTIIRGSSTGLVYAQLVTQTSDAGSPISCELRSREEDWGDSRTQKQISDQIIDVDPANQAVTPTILFDGNSSSELLTTLTGAARSKFIRDVNSGLGTFANRAAISLAWSGLTGITKLYEWMPSALAKIELTARRVTDWDASGYDGPKWLQGMRLRADTLNIVKSIQVQYDEGLVAASLDIQHNGEVTKEYSWTPVVAHQMRILGLDDDAWRNLGVEWVFEPEPGLALRWHIQFTDLDLPGFTHIRELLLAHRSTADISLEWVADSTSNIYPIPSSGGLRRRAYLPLAAVKAKYHQAIFTSSQPFALYKQDIEVRTGAWGRSEAYVTQRPFGDFSRATGDGGGARI